MVHFRNRVQLVECPRDAMQGWKTFIPTATKIEYLNLLLTVGFHTLDCGSFVSPKAIPQMADTKEVIEGLQVGASQTRILVIVANTRGAQDAVQIDKIHCIGFPFSISPTFQMRNANSSIDESLQRLDTIQELCLQNNKELVVYLSMGFGNPYGDDYDEETLLYWADEMVKRNVKTISLADTTGIATPDQINFAVSTLVAAYPTTDWGLHLHSTPHNWLEKLEAAVDGGCRRFDGSLNGIGGCPMASDQLVGNMNTQWMIHYFRDRNILKPINEEALQHAARMVPQVFVAS